MTELVLTVTDFVGLFNQTMELAYPSVVVVGELANFRISKNKGLYFDIKDELASVKCFGTVFQLPGPMEDGLSLEVRAQPRLHPQYGFSLNVLSLRPVGEGSILKAAQLLEAKLAKEGLFDPARKRPLPHPPASIGLITSGGSAAYHDFIEILGQRWGGIEVLLADVQVQGEVAAGQIVRAINYFNSSQAVDVIVITRGGGSADDLASFNTETVTRAVSTSRVPTLVAIGHEVDVSLAELAADKRASTPTNAAQLLVPDRLNVLENLKADLRGLYIFTDRLLKQSYQDQQRTRDDLAQLLTRLIKNTRAKLQSNQEILQALSPSRVLARGYSIVRKKAAAVKSSRQLQPGDLISIQFSDGVVGAAVEDV